MNVVPMERSLSGIANHRMDLFSDKASEGLRCYPSNDTLIIELLQKSYCLLYGIPSLTLYVLALLALRRNQASYSSTFVHLFSLSCIYNIGCWVMEYVFSRIFNISYFCNFLVSLTATYFLVPPFFIYQFFPLASFVCCVMIALYQTTALIAPLDIEKKWCNRLHLLTILSAGIPAFCCSHLFIGYTTVMPLPSGKLYVKALHWWDWMYQLTTPAVNSVIGSISFVIIIICTTVSIIRLFQLRKKNDKRVQIRVFFVIFLMSTTSLIFAIYQVLLFYTRTFLQDNYKISDVIQWREFMVDACYLPLPWIVILVNSRVRRSLPLVNRMTQPKVTVTGTWATTISPFPDRSSPR